MARKGKDADWNLYGEGNISWEKVPISVLMDIRDELKEANIQLRLLNRVFNCSNFQSIPNKLRRISRNTFVAKHKREPGRGEL